MRNAPSSSIIKSMVIALIGMAWACLAQQQVTIQAIARDSVTPWPDASCLIEASSSIGHVGNGNAIRFSDVVFPAGILRSITIEHGGPNPAQLEFSLDDKSNGLLFALCAITSTTADFLTFVTTTFDNPEMVAPIQLAGTRDLWVAFSGGGPNGEGLGNFTTFTFTFESTSARTVHGVIPNSKTAVASRSIMMLSSPSGVLPSGRMTNSSLFDIRGRRMNAATMHGIAIAVRPSQSGTAHK